MTVAIPDKPTGADLYEVLRAAAAQQGRTMHDICRPMGTHPSRWLEQLRVAAAPRALTIAKVRAIVTGRPVPTEAEHKRQRARQVKVMPEQPTKHDPPVPEVSALPPRRTACPWCATRADMHAAFGCNRRWE